MRMARAALCSAAGEVQLTSAIRVRDSAVFPRFGYLLVAAIRFRKMDQLVFT